MFDFCLILYIQWFDVPDTVCIFVDATITAEETHASNTGDTLGDPGILILVRSVDEILCCEVGVEVIRDKVVIAMLNNCVDEGGEGPLVAESTLLDGFENAGQSWVDLILAVEVVVAKIFNIFC